VTGAAGFIGSHVAAYLEDQGHEVIRSDISIPSSSTSVWKRADLTSLNDTERAVEGVDSVCHIGGIGDVYLAADSPQLAIHVNGCGTSNILSASSRNRVRRFVYASSWEVYGDPIYQPADEQHPCRPHHPYAISKLVGDLLTQGRVNGANLQTTALRLGTAYGSRMRKNAVISSFVRLAIRGEPLVIRGSGEQFRQFTHVSDIAKAFGLALGADTLRPVYNIASSERITIRDLAKQVASRIASTVMSTASRPGDAPSLYVDSRLAERELRWRTDVPFINGLNAYIDNVQDEYPEAASPEASR